MSEELGISINWVHLIFDLVWLFFFGGGVYLCQKLNQCARLNLYDHHTRMKGYLIALALVLVPSVISAVLHVYVFVGIK